MNRKWINFPECPSVDSMLQSSSAVTAHPMQVSIHFQWFSPSLLHGSLVSPWPDPLGALIWAGLAAREQGGFCQPPEKDVSSQSTQANLNQWLNEDGSKEQPLLAIKRKKKKRSFSALCSVPLCFNHHPSFTLKRRAELKAPACKVFLKDTVHYCAV